MDKLIREQIEAINSTMNRINELYAKWAKKHGLNYNSLMIIYAMYEMKICTQKQICNEWMMPKQTVNSIFMELRDKGYLIFETDSTDKRERRARFSDTGLQYAKNILEGLLQIEENVMKKMGKEACNWMLVTNQEYCRIFETEVDNE